MKASVLDTITLQYVIDNSGKKTGVLLDLKTFNLIIEELEDLRDVREAEQIIAEGEKAKGRTLEEIEKSLKKKN